MKKGQEVKSRTQEGRWRERSRDTNVKAERKEE